MENVILVNTDDQVVGEMEKLEAHRQGLLHRAFSVLVFNTSGEMLLQQRANSKYHSGGLWTNACCSHPRPGEDSAAAAHRRLQEEIGLEGKPEFLYKFVYKAELDNQLTEHELDHVFTYTTNQLPTLNPDEVEDFRYIAMNDLFADVEAHPHNYTVWFRMIVENLKNKPLAVNA